MTRTCIVERPGLHASAAWRLESAGPPDQAVLMLHPEGHPPETYRLAEISALAGDEFTIQLTVPTTATRVPATQAPAEPAASAPAATPHSAPGTAGRFFLVLSRLGKDGADLLTDLWRLWPLARASALRLAGPAESKRFRGTVRTIPAAQISGGHAAGAGAATAPGGREAGEEPTGHWVASSISAGPERPAHVLVYDDHLLMAPDAGEMQPLFVALLDSVEFNPQSYRVVATAWDGSQVEFGRLAGQTDEFLEAVRECRATVVGRTEEALREVLPRVGAAERAALAAAWPVGRPLSPVAMDVICPGFTTILSASLKDGPRATEAASLLSAPAPERCRLFVTPSEFADVGPEDENAGRSPVADSLTIAGDDANAGSWALWLILRFPTGKAPWVLECLNHSNVATYVFSDMPEQLSSFACLGCSPQFIGRALFLTEPEMAEDHAELLIPSRHLPFLTSVRSNFRGRVLHSGDPASWERRLRQAAGL